MWSFFFEISASFSKVPYAQALTEIRRNSFPNIYIYIYIYLLIHLFNLELGKPSEDNFTSKRARTVCQWWYCMIMLRMMMTWQWLSARLRKEQAASNQVFFFDLAHSNCNFQVSTLLHILYSCAECAVKKIATQTAAPTQVRCMLLPACMAHGLRNAAMCPQYRLETAQKKTIKKPVTNTIEQRKNKVHCWKCLRDSWVWCQGLLPASMRRACHEGQQDQRHLKQIQGPQVLDSPHFIWIWIRSLPLSLSIKPSNRVKLSN